MKKNYNTSEFMKTALFSCLLFSVSPAIAETTAWEDLGGGRARLVSIFNPVTNRVEGAIDVELLPGWTTYWRNPGEAGIPPEFDFSESKGIAVDAPGFPVPITKTTGGIVTIGYAKKVSFPFSGEALISPLSGTLKLNILLGVCEEVCIPAVASFEQDLTTLNHSDPISSALIENAKRMVPIRNADQAGWPKILDVSRDRDNKILVVAKVPPSSNSVALYVEGKKEWYFEPAKIAKRDGDNIEFEVNLEDLPDSADLTSAPLRFTLAVDGIGSEAVVTLE